jgi:hypothetical protein
MQQVIEWIQIMDDIRPPHREYCYFMNYFNKGENKEIVTGYYQVHDGKWVVVEPTQELTFKIPLYEFTHFAKVEL